MREPPGPLRLARWEGAPPCTPVPTGGATWLAAPGWRLTSPAPALLHRPASVRDAEQNDSSDVLRIRLAGEGDAAAPWGQGPVRTCALGAEHVRAVGRGADSVWDSHSSAAHRTCPRVVPVHRLQGRPGQTHTLPVTDGETEARHVAPMALARPVPPPSSGLCCRRRARGTDWWEPHPAPALHPTPAVWTRSRMSQLQTHSFKRKDGEQKQEFTFP